MMIDKNMAYLSDKMVIVIDYRVVEANVLALTWPKHTIKACRGRLQRPHRGKKNVNS